MFTDMIVNGHGVGPVASTLEDVRFEPGFMRPFKDHTGQRMCTYNAGYEMKPVEGRMGEYERVPVMKTDLLQDLAANGVYSPVFNSTSLRIDEWRMLDRVVLTAARQRLRAWADLAASNTFGGFNGMTKMLLEHETMSDPGEARQDMDGLSEVRGDSPKFQLEGLPLPITHSGFWFAQRRLAISRQSGTPLDTAMGEAAGRRVGELVEKVLIGNVDGLTYGEGRAGGGAYGRTSAVYGYTNFPARLTKTNLTIPLGTNPEATVADVLTMRDQLYAAKFYGPYMIYHSTDWDRFLDNDYARLGGNNASMTLRDRLRSIDGIQDVRRLDFLTSDNDPFTLVMVQMTSDVARAVNGLDITTVQWESQGGMRLNFKVLCIHVPQLRADYNGNCGLLHATTA
jgi:hypothetical protein